MSQTQRLLLVAPDAMIRTPAFDRATELALALDLPRTSWRSTTWSCSRWPVCSPRSRSSKRVRVIWKPTGIGCGNRPNWRAGTASR